MNRSAIISHCGLYRYQLWRTCGEGPYVVFICLNPSTADGTIDDATIRRCIAFAQAWGFSGFCMVNLFAFRATKPEDMRAAADPVGPENDRHILEVVAKADKIVCGWGSNGDFRGRDGEVEVLLRDYELTCLATTKAGRPGHPLYLKKNLTPVAYSGVVAIDKSVSRDYNNHVPSLTAGTSKTQTSSQGTPTMDPAKLAALLAKKKASLKTFERTIKPKPGSNRYVILPGWKNGEEETFWRDFGQHFIKDASDTLLAVYPCAKHTDGESCELCDIVKKAETEAVTDDQKELIKQSASSKNYLVNVLDLDGTDPNTPQILELRTGVFGQLVTLMEDWGEGIFNPTRPQIVLVERTGKGINTKYSASISSKFHDAMPRGVHEKIHNLDEYVKQESEERMKLALSSLNKVAGALSSVTGGARPALGNAPVTADPTDHSGVISRNAAATAAASGGLNDELDNLLKDMGIEDAKAA